jgi:glycosyl hydrolase family 42 (putative beta-galactosidase)
MNPLRRGARAGAAHTPMPTLASSFRHTLVGRLIGAIGRQRRRALVSVMNLGLSVAVLSGLGVVPPPNLGGTPQTEVGVTFSRRQAEYLGLPWQKTFSDVLELSPTVVRLGAYWDEIARRRDVYDFSTLDWQLARLPAQNYRVVLTVGMKAPRWPEYYLPSWLMRETKIGQRGTISDDPLVQAEALRFVEAVVTRYQDNPAIAYWQVENEPLDPSGPRQWKIGADFVAQEVALVRSLDHLERPVILSMFVDTPPPLASLPPWRSHDESRARALLDMADILGLDVYPSRGIRFFGRDLYLNWSGWAWERPAVSLRQIALQLGKDAWIMEAQAEPWEPSRLVYLEDGQSKSVQPGTAADTFGRLSNGGFGTILLWGAEHWYMRQERHDDRSWLDTLRPLFRSNDQLAGTDGRTARLPLDLGREPPN